MRVLEDDFYNKVATKLKRVYFPGVSHGITENDNYYGMCYTIELFSNGCIKYDALLNKLSKQCNADKTAIHGIVSKYINAEFNFSIKETK